MSVEIDPHVRDTIHRRFVDHPQRGDGADGPIDPDTLLAALVAEEFLRVQWSRLPKLWSR